MHQILPHLFIGDITDARSRDTLRAHKITLIINCAAEIPNFFPNEFKYINLSVDDNATERSKLSDELFRTRTLNVILHYVSNQKNVLVHCHQGVSRSASVVAIFLHKVLNIPMAEAVAIVKQRRPGAFKYGYNFL